MWCKWIIRRVVTQARLDLGVEVRSCAWNSRLGVIVRNSFWEYFVVILMNTYVVSDLILNIKNLLVTFENS